MKVDNNKIFNKVWNTANKFGLSFISSNGGTGKTTYFKFRFLRDALGKNETFHIFCRYGNQMEILANSFLLSKPSFSNRQNKLLDKCEVYKESDKFIFIVEKETKRKLAQIVNIYGQSYYKPFGNIIASKRAFFDEVLAENGEYCPDEINKFNRLVFTLARNDEYKVFCLYNNSSPNFEYFKYYKGINFNTHVSHSGALFLYFTARQFTSNDTPKEKNSIQSIIQNTAYDDVYNHNQFIQFEVYYKNENLYNAQTLFKLEIENRLFKVRAKDGYLFLDEHKATKKNNKQIFSVNDPSRTEIKQLSDGVRVLLSTARENATLKTNNINNTVFVKILAERV